jgi:co-chaperonin GroES (HSP10)
MEIVPLGSNVVIMPEEHDISKEGVFMTSSKKQMLALGTIIDSGEASLFKGDKVLYFFMKSHAALPGEDLILIDAKDVVAKVI